jgi:hypothetical protein
MIQPPRRVHALLMRACARACAAVSYERTAGCTRAAAAGCVYRRGYVLLANLYTRVRAQKDFILARAARRWHACAGVLREPLARGCFLWNRHRAACSKQCFARPGTPEWVFREMALVTFC